MSALGIGSGLRRRLVALLVAFGAFAVLSAAATILGTHWYVERAAGDFEQQIGRAVRADRLALLLQQQSLLLRTVIDGENENIRPYIVAIDEFEAIARQIPSASALDVNSPEAKVTELAARLVAESTRCIEAIGRDDLTLARQIAVESIDRGIRPELNSGLMELKERSAAKLSQSSHQLASTSAHVLTLTLLVAVAAAVLVVVGALLIRRWLIAPIGLLCAAAREFGRGNFSFRAAAPTNNELGALGAAMNEMAASVANANEKLRSSESKHRQLFRELRDAVVLVDEQGLVIEYHDDETELLGVDGSEHVGRSLLAVWPAWAKARLNWEANIQAAIRDGRRFRAIDVELSRPGDDVPAFVDVLVYRTALDPSRQAAVVLRDVTERTTLQRRLRHAETMEAVGTLASGLAHDFNNLLAGVTANLSALETQLPNEQHAARVRSAIRACWQAAGLSRRLLNFAGSVHGAPEVFDLTEGVRTILEALDPSFLEGVNLTPRFEQNLVVRMDRDQFTQTLLNLLRNAREAMPDGGSIRVSTSRLTARHPESLATQAFALLSVADTGCGMPPEVQARIFEPFFTTKSRDTHRGRGMGMAIVYAAVRNAGGHIRIVSSAGAGTEFQVHLPLSDADSAHPISSTRGPEHTVVDDQIPPRIAADSSGSFKDNI